MGTILRRWWPAAPFERAVAAFFVMVLLAYGITAFVNAPLTYDGAFSFFRMMENNGFAEDYDRMVNIPLQVPVLTAARFTSDTSVLEWIFSAPYCAIPILGLALSWLICRRRPSLFIWPALSICLAEMPGRFFFTNEQVILATLFWPALLTALLGAPALIFIAVALISIVATASQPVAAASLMTILLVALVSAILKPQLRDKSLWFALFMGLLLLQRLTTPLYEWEKSSLSMNIVSYSFDKAVWGWPLIATGFTLLAGLACLMAPGRRARVLLIAPLTLAGASLITWAVQPAVWYRLIDFRYWVTPITLLLMAGAAFDELWPRPDRRPDSELQEVRRLPIVLVGTIFLIVLSIQSVEWQGMNQRLSEDMASSDAGCVPRTALNWLLGTPLAHWGGAFNAIEVQGPKPKTLLLATVDDCRDFANEGDAKLVNLEKFKYHRDMRGRYFDFQDANSRARTQSFE